MLPAVQHAVKVHNRLRNPPNAVPDHGIDLKRKVVPIRPEQPEVEMPCDCGPPPVEPAEPTAEEQAMIDRLFIHDERPLVAVDRLREKIKLLRYEMTELLHRFEWVDVEKENSARPKIAQIQQAVCKFYGITMTDIKSARRSTSVVHARQIAMYLCKTLTLRSLKEVGRLFGGKDHSTVIHAVKKIEANRQTDAVLNDEISAIERQIDAAFNAVP